MYEVMKLDKITSFQQHHISYTRRVVSVFRISSLFIKLGTKMYRSVNTGLSEFGLKIASCVVTCIVVLRWPPER